MSISRYIAAVLVVTLASAAAPPAARVAPYTQTFYGTVRSDPYHWMEAGGPNLLAYLRRQTAYTHDVLRNISGRRKIRKAVTDAFGSSGAAASTSGVIRVGSHVFFLQDLPNDDAPSLLSRADGRSVASVIVNAKTLAKGEIIAWFVPSPNGSKIAYGATRSSEYVVVHVCNANGANDVAQAIEPSVIPYVAWHGESAFYYPSVRASTTNRTETSYLHELGDARGHDVPIAGYGVRGPMGSQSSRDLYSTYAVLDGNAVVATIQHDVTPHQAVFVAPFVGATRANGPWRRLFTYEDGVVAVAAAGNSLYALTDRGSARRSILIRNLSTGASVRTIAPDRGYREAIFANRSGLFVAERVGSLTRVEHYDANGSALGPLAIPPVNAIGAFDGVPEGNVFALQSASFADPNRWFEIDGARETVRPMRENLPLPPLYDGIRSTDRVATSRDGTKIPYNVIYRDGTPRDGKRPTVVIGYGAYGYDIEPPVPPEIAALLRLGVVIVLAHVRGGGEFGETWHLAGKGRNKQHTIDDFIACARDVIDSGWTSTAKLAGYGASAGGITIGGAITQHPELFAVAISEVGFNDMVDLENMPNGPGNVPEFGSVKSREGFRNLLAMSAYDHVVPAAYPATLLTTGLNDQRDAPWQVAKMAARLQASTTSGKPVLLRADDQGHGVIRDPSTQIESYTDEFTFLLWQLGEPGFRVK